MKKTAKQEHQRVRCAIYARKSTNNGMEKEFSSIDAQLAECTSYINMRASLGWEVTATYADVAISGATLDRPEMQALLAAARRRDFDCIVIYKLDRISRSMKDFANLMYEFDELGVTLAITSQGFDTNTEVGRLSLSILASFAEFERAMIRSRIHDKCVATREAGLWSGAVRPFGYSLEQRSLVVRPDEAALVKDTFRLFVSQGLTPTEIARHFNKAGRFYTSPRKNAQVGPWSPQTVTRVLRSRVYTGETEFEGEIYPGKFEPIIPKHIWQAAVSKLDRIRDAIKERSHGKGLVFPLKGILTCCRCGAKLGSSFTTHRNGTVHRYYICPNHRGRYRSCDCRPLSADMTEEAVGGGLDRLMEDPELQRALEDLLPGAERRDIQDALFNFPVLLGNMTLEQKQALFQLTLKGVCYDEDRRELNFTYND